MITNWILCHETDNDLHQAASENTHWAEMSGFGVYETLKMRDGLVYFAKRHIRRLYASAEALGLAMPVSPDQLETCLLRYTDGLPGKNYNLKMVASQPDNQKSVQLALGALPAVFPAASLYLDGAKAVLYRGERQLPQVKSLQLVVTRLAYQWARQQGAYDALWLHPSGLIAEGTRTNLLYSDGQQIMFSPRHKILAGVTQETIIECCQQNGIKWRERPLFAADLDHGFVRGLAFTSTSTKIIPITHCAGRDFEIPAIIRRLMSLYDEYLQHTYH